MISRRVPFGTTFGPVLSFYVLFRAVVQALKQKKKIVDFTMEFDTLYGVQKGHVLDVFAMLTGERRHYYHTL